MSNLKNLLTGGNGLKKVKFIEASVIENAFIEILEGDEDFCKYSTDDEDEED